MESFDKKLGQQLMEVGDTLVDPPPSVDGLLSLLDKVENLLSTVEQSPSLPMKNAMSMAHKVLVADKFLKHSDADVRVAAASCLTEILRIAAPDAPYNDDIMKNLFQLIVSTFENLDDESSRSYAKRLMILDTSAKVQSCAVMLDLECDELITEMFQIFLRTIRDYHPETVFSSMVAIMTLVFEESEEISPEMLSPILACLRQDDGGALPIAQRLAETAFRTCSPKAKTNLKKAIQAMGISLVDYSEAVAFVCREKFGGEEQNQVAADLNANQVDEVIPSEAAPVEADVPNDISPRSEISNDVTQAGKEESLFDSGSTKKEEHASYDGLPENADRSSNAEPDNQGCEHIKHANASLVADNKAAESFVASENGKEKEQVKRTNKDAKQSVDDASRDAPGASDSEAKTATLTDVAKKESNLATDSEEKPPKRLRKKVDKYDDYVDGSSRRTMKLVEPKASPGKDSSEASAKDDEKKTITPKSSPKACKDEHGSEATPKTNSKRKRMPAKEKAVTSSVEEKASDAEDCGESLINSRIKVWWPLDHAFYEGVVSSYDSAKKKHLVVYDDGDQEILNLKREKWELIESHAKADENEADGERSPDTSKMPEKKKQKMNTNQKPAKQGKQTDSLAKSKSKVLGTKSGEKSKDEKKKVEKNREITELETEIVKKDKDKSVSVGVGGKMVAVASRLTAKSRANDAFLGGYFNGSNLSTKSEKDTQEWKSSKSGQKTPRAWKSKANETSMEDDVNGNTSKKETPKHSKSKQENPKASGKSRPKAKTSGGDDDERTPLLNLIRKLRVAASNSKENEGGESGKKRKR